MKEFGIPHMTAVYLASENIIVTSLCVEQYCDGFTCPQCDGDKECPVQSPCHAHECGHYLCPTYS